QQQQQQQQQHDHQSIESVVEGMEISQAMDLVSSTTANSASDASAGGLYSDRDASAWLTPSATYNHGHSGGATAGHHSGTANENSGISSGFPFPMVRDRKELARAAGIRLDIPTSRQQQQQQQQQQQLWLQNMTAQNASSGNNAATIGAGNGSDEMVGGSTTSNESPATGDDSHSTSQSPVLLTTSSTAASSSASSASSVNPAQMDSSADGENMTMKSINENGTHLHNTNNTNTNASAISSYGKSKGSNLEVFPTPTTTASTANAATVAAAAAAAADAGFYTVGVSAATDYLAKDVPVIRRHSTHLSNLSA
ncbi:hypothetical protein BGZ67_008316, partial [Mortierella alpina]